MYYVYLLSFKFLRHIGLKRTSVRIARSLARHCRQPFENSKLYAAIWEFILVQTFPFCDSVESGCYFPVLSDDDPFHQSCREKQAEIDAAWAEYDAELALQREAAFERIATNAEHYEALIASFCTESGCFEPHNGCGKCDAHDTFCWICMDDPCRCADAEAETCEPDDELDDSAPDEECPDGCGQTVRTCTCAELASWKRHIATGAEGYWTA